MVNNTTQ